MSLRFLSAAAVLLSAGRLGAAVISEVHYNPPARDWRRVEFVELHNPRGEPEDLSGYRLTGGIELTLPGGTILAPGGYIALCKDVDAVAERFGAPSAALVGGITGFIDNAGDSIALLDPSNAFVDGLTFDDEAPWPEPADGKGASLQRLCMTASAGDPLNWFAGDPTPGAPAARSTCPPPAYPPPRVAITEIQYHPLQGKALHPAIEDGEDAEFIELFNAGAAPVDLGGWKLEDAVDLQIPAGTVLPPHGYIVAGRDPEKLKSKLGITNVIAAGYQGRLSNTSDRVALASATGELVDSVLYRDSGDWPYGADGAGRSLERVAAALSGNDPANWKTSRIFTPDFQTLVGEGPAGQGLGQKLVLSLDGPGELLVDAVKLEDITTDDVKTVLDEGFDAGIAGWIPAGVASSSVFAPGAGQGGSGALRLISTAPCPNGDCGTTHSVSKSIAGLNRQGKFRVTVVFKAVSGSPLFYAGLFKGAGVSITELSSAGKPNTVEAAELPPFITQVHRYPLEPRSTDATWITALVRAKGVPAVTLSFTSVTDGVKGPVGSLTLRDDGRHRDHLAGDGVYGGELPAFPHNTQVRFRISAVAGDQVAEYPRPLNAGASLEEEVSGYYVDDLQPDTPLALYHILIDELKGNGVDDVNNLLRNCEVTLRASFASKGDLYPDVRVRFRGNTACYVRKRNFKVTFNRGLLFKGLKKINLNSEWTDKSLVREHLAWDFFREVGSPYCETRFTRLHVNGGYFGLYLYVEHPDGNFLQRNDLDAGGNLYKAKQPPNDGGLPIGVEAQPTREAYRQFWEEETNEEGDFADIQEFIDSLHADGRQFGGPTSAFFQQGTIEEMIIGYQLGQVVLNNIDSFAKNHFLYHDLQRSRWGIVTWDMDLTFGKFFTFAAVDPAQGREVGTLNDYMLCGPEVNGDLNPWFGSTVLQNPLLHHLIDFFLRAGRGFYQRAYLIRLWDILDEKFRNETYDPRLDGLLAFLAGEEQLDHERWKRYTSNVPDYPEDMASNIQIVKDQIACHRDFLRDFIRSFHSEVVEHPRLKITEVMYLPENGDDDLEFLEVLNTGDAPASLKDWRIRGLGRDDGDFTFPDAVVQPAEVFIVARSPAAFRDRYPDRQALQVFGPYSGKLDNDGEELRILDSGPGFPATIDYLKYGNGGDWPDPRPGRSIELTDVAPDRDNDPGANWVESRQQGGTPGATEPIFVRANVNGDPKVDLTDVIFILNYLFRGGATPVCLDAGDANDDGQVGITDAIFILQHLFQGGIAPYPPYPDPGPDPTRDELGC